MRNMSRGRFLRGVGAGAAAGAMGVGARRVRAMASDAKTTMNDVLARGYLMVGIRQDNGPGMFDGWPEDSISYPLETMELSESNNATGLEADCARALAVAIFGDWKDRIKFFGTNPTTRFQELQKGTVDVVFRAGTHTWTRDFYNVDVTPVYGYKWGPVYYHDGMNILVRTDATAPYQIAVDYNSTTRPALEEVAAMRSDVEVVIIPENAPLQAKEEFLAGNYDGVAGDASALYGMVQLASFNVRFLLANNYGKEPLAPILREGDEHWHELVNGCIWALQQAEEDGITKSAVTTSKWAMKKTATGWRDIWETMVPQNGDWPRDIIYKLGNYAELWVKNFGTLDRGPNKLERDGGYINTPAFR